MQILLPCKFTTFYFGFSFFTFFQIEKLYMDCWTISFSFKIFHLHSAPYSDGISPSLVWPQWWSFADVSQQALHSSKKISKRKYFFDLTFTDVHMDRQKVPKSDFQSQFSMSKNVQIFLKKIFIEEYQFRTTFFVKYIFR